MGSPLTESLAVSVCESGHSKKGGAQSGGNILLNHGGPVSVSQSCVIRLSETCGTMAGGKMERACPKVGVLRLGSRPKQKVSFILGKVI